jgi:hypothetical protein
MNLSDLLPTGVAGPAGTSGTSGSSYYFITGYTGTNLTLSADLAGDYIRTTSATAVTINIPTQASASWPDNTEILIEQAGAGQITFSPALGVVVNTSETLKTQKQYSIVAIKRVSSDVWTFFGERELV